MLQLSRRFLLPGLLLALAVPRAFAGETHDAWAQQRLAEGLSGPRPAINLDHRIPLTERRIALTLDYFERHNAALAEQRQGIEGVEAIRFDPQVLVMHYTVIPTAEQTLAYFAREEMDSGRPEILANGLLNVGIQFVVDRDGTIYGLYPEDVMARHTIGLNHVAIGIENVGDGDLGSDAALPLTEAQVAANVALIRYLAGKYPNLRWAIGHQEYRDLEHPDHPARHLFVEDKPDYRTEKVDPGDRFLAAVRRELAP